MNPLVSICCTTYNHQDYIKDTLDGFLMQKVDFPIEILIHDDASTDDTVSIIKEYETEHPHLLRLILQDKNQYSHGIDVWNTYLLPAAKGKYLALCEGDDFWTDPLKLKKQASFMEKNHDYGFIHTDINQLIQNTGVIIKKTNKALNNNCTSLSRRDLFYMLSDASYKIRTATVMFRKNLLYLIPKDDKKFLMGDTPLWFNLSQLTKFKYLDDVTAVYRVLPESASHSLNKKKHSRFKYEMAIMRLYYCKKYGYEPNKNLINRYNHALIKYRLTLGQNSTDDLISPTWYQILKSKVYSDRFFSLLESFERKLEKYRLHYLHSFGTR